MKDRSKVLAVINTGKRKEPSESLTTQVIKGGSGGSIPSGSYLQKSVWDKCWEIKTTEKGEEYLFCKLPVGLQFDLTSFVDGGSIDLPDIYDGLPIDGQTLKWKEVTNEDGSVTRVLESIGSGGTADKVTWANIEGKPSWIGSSKPTYSYSEITGKPDLSDMATKTWVGNNYLVKTGGTLSGDLRLKGSSNYGMTLYFGDGSYCYITEPSDDEMKIHASNGVVIETGNSYYVEVDSKGIKINGGIITYNGSYWEIEGDVLVTGDITFNS